MKHLKQIIMFKSIGLLRNITLFITLGVSCLTCMHQGMQDEGNPPNILCLVCEDISPYLGCYGDPVALTPQLDRLASDGIRFTRMYSVSGVCAPSRNALITGMYPSSIGGNHMRTGNRMHVENVPDSLQVPPYECTPPPYVKCYTEYLRAAGYYCTNNDKEDYQFAAPRSAWDESGRHAHWRNRPEGMPFFSIFNFIRSHESQIWAWEQEPWIIHPDSVEVPPYYPDTPLIRRDIARMHSNNAIMDREVGEIIRQLEEDGLLEETVIIFYSDHGGPLPRGKREILESGTRVPFIVRMPGREGAGSVVDELCSFVDIPATILSLAGVEVPGHMHGQAFLGPQKASPRNYIFGARDRMDEWFDCRRSVRDDRYRYIRNYRTDIGAYLDIGFRKQMNTMQELLALRDAGALDEQQLYWFRKVKEQEELYDVEKDPFELKNLAADPAHQEVLNRLSGALDQWLTEIDDKGIRYTTEQELMYSMWPEGIQPATDPPVLQYEDGKASLTSSTPGASIVYQLNHKGYTPGHWLLYTDPLQLVPGDTVTAVAYRIGYLESDVEEFVIFR
jgi:arylsulfatase A-like enzyme